MSGSIAGNYMSLLIYRNTSAEGVVLHNCGIDGVAQLFGVNDLNDPKTNWSKVEGGLFTEELATRYPLIVIKCNSLRGNCGGGTSSGPCPQRALPQDLPNGNFHSLHRKLFREEQEGGVPCLPSYFTIRGIGYWSLPSTNLCKDTKIC
jgi:hypothetical protein